MSRTIFGVLSLSSFATAVAQMSNGCIYVPVLHEIPHSDENNEDNQMKSCGLLYALVYHQFNSCKL